MTQQQFVPRRVEDYYADEEELERNSTVKNMEEAENERVEAFFLINENVSEFSKIGNQSFNSIENKAPQCFR